MKKFTLLTAAALIGATALSSHSQEHEERYSEQTEQREHYSLDGERSESDAHFSDQISRRRRPQDQPTRAMKPPSDGERREPQPPLTTP